MAAVVVKPARFEVTIVGYDQFENRRVEIVGVGRTPATAYANAVKMLEAVIVK